MPKFCRSVLFLLLLVCMIALGSVTVTAQRTFHATVDGAQEVPPNASTAIGTGTVTLNPAETQITVSLNFSGLSTGQTAAHVHGAGPRGTSAGVLFGLPTGKVTNQIFPVTAGDVANLKAGLFYFNVHTTGFSSGEIRGQIEPVCEPVPVGLVSWWSGDGNTLDSRSRNNGTLQNGATFAGGQVGQAFVFDGIDDVVRVPTNANLRPAVWTLETWVNPRFLRSTMNGFDAVITYGSTTNFSNSYFLGFRNEKLYTAVSHDAAATVITEINSNASIALNQWAHLAATFDGIFLRLYVNGVLIDSLAANSSLPFYDTASDVLIGADTNQNIPGVHFNGLIDEAAIYNRALSASEIATIHAAGTAGKCKPTATTSPSGQVAWFAGDGSAGDIAGTNNGSLQNGAAFAVGKVGQTFNLDGNDDSIQLSLNQSFQNFTLESWVNPSVVVSDPLNQELILGQASYGAQLVVVPGTSGGMRVKIQYRDTLNSFAQVVSTNDIPLNDWSHLVGTFDGTTLKLHVNSVLNAQLSPTNTTVQTCNTPYFIGGFQTVTDCNNIQARRFSFSTVELTKPPFTTAL